MSQFKRYTLFMETMNFNKLDIGSVSVELPCDSGYMYILAKLKTIFVTF